MATSDPAGDPRAPADVPEPRLDLVMYGVAAVVLIGLGILLTTPVLNWIVGPALVVAVVSLGTPAVERLRRGHRR